MTDAFRTAETLRIVREMRKHYILSAKDADFAADILEEICTGATPMTPPLTPPTTHPPATTGADAERRYTDEDIRYAIADLQAVERGDNLEMPLLIDRDQRTRAGQLWLMLHQLAAARASLADPDRPWRTPGRVGDQRPARWLCNDVFGRNGLVRNR